MRAILEHCGDLPLEQVTDGTVLVGEGQKTGHVYILARGRVEVSAETPRSPSWMNLAR